MKIYEKRYYMRDLAKMLSVTNRTIFNWEKLGKIPKAKRDPMSNFRYFTEKDVEKLRKITGRD